LKRFYQCPIELANNPIAKVRIRTQMYQHKDKVEACKGPNLVAILLLSRLREG
jgi:hypothetical protein